MSAVFGPLFRLARSFSIVGILGPDAAELEHIRMLPDSSGESGIDTK